MGSTLEEKSEEQSHLWKIAALFQCGCVGKEKETKARLLKIMSSTIQEIWTNDYAHPPGKFLPPLVREERVGKNLGMFQLKKKKKESRNVS